MQMFAEKSRNNLQGTYCHVTRGLIFLSDRAFSLSLSLSLSLNFSHSVSPRGAVHADVLPKHQRRVRVCCKFLYQSYSRACSAISVTSCSPFPSNFLTRTSLKMLSKILSLRLVAPRLSRGLATHAPNPFPIPAALHLKSGQSFHGRSFGTPKSIYGETVFSTSITSCEFFFLSSMLNLTSILLQTPNQ